MQHKLKSTFFETFWRAWGAKKFLFKKNIDFGQFFSVFIPLHYGKKGSKIGKILVSNWKFGNAFLAVLPTFMDHFYDKFWIWNFFLQ